MTYDELEPDDDPEPRCVFCGAGLYTERHDEQCPYRGGEANDDDSDRETEQPTA